MKLILALLFTISSFSHFLRAQTIDPPFKRIMKYENDGIKLKKSFSEKNKIDEYYFEVTPNSKVKASGKNEFYQYENKNWKNTQPNNVEEFLDYLDKKLIEFNFNRVYTNQEDRIITYQNNKPHNESLIELYYEDDQLSLLEITYLKQYNSKGEYFNVDSIYGIESIKFDFEEYEINQKSIEQILSQSKNEKEIDPLNSESKGDSVVIHYDIDFEAGKLSINDKSIKYIKSLASIIKSEPQRKFIIAGNTSTAGARFSNYILSLNRAKLLSKILINYFNVDKQQLFYKGNGEQYQLYDNKTEENRIRNRRIDLLRFQQYAPKLIRK